MSFCYSIRDWNKHFENSESRKYKSLTWVPMKNKHDGKGYRRVCQHPKSIQIFCAWCLLVQVASKMPVRGLLRDDDGPLTASDLSFKTGLPGFIFEEAFKVLVDPKIGWLEKHVDSEISGHTTGEQNGHEQKRTEQHRPTDYPKLKGRGGLGEEPPRGVRSPAGPVPPASDDKLSDANSLEIARAILSQAAINGTFYDNCQVKPEMFTIGALRTVLREFYGRAALIWLPPAFKEAVSSAHARCVDGTNNERLEPVEKPGGLAIEIFRERLEFRIKQSEEKR